MLPYVRVTWHAGIDITPEQGKPGRSFKAKARQIQGQGPKFRSGLKAKAKD